MTPLRIAFITIAVLNILLNIFFMITTRKSIGISFNAIGGWSCSILYAIQ